MDRNVSNLLSCGGVLVALRKESVDRNIDLTGMRFGRLVALRKESVDRNNKFLKPFLHFG